MKINAYYTRSKDGPIGTAVYGKHKLIDVVLKGQAYTLEGTKRLELEENTIVQLIEIDKNLGTFYIPKVNISYIDILITDSYDELKVNPFTNNIWNQINEA